MHLNKIYTQCRNCAYIKPQLTASRYDSPATMHYKFQCSSLRSHLCIPKLVEYFYSHHFRIYLLMFLFSQNNINTIISILKCLGPPKIEVTSGLRSKSGHVYSNVRNGNGLNEGFPIQSSLKQGVLSRGLSNKPLETCKETRKI
jgi:hypothetical protein